MICTMVLKWIHFWVQLSIYILNGFLFYWLECILNIVTIIVSRPTYPKKISNVSIYLLIITFQSEFKWSFYLCCLGVNFVWQIYDSTNEGVDAFYLGDLLRALETNPTLATIEKLGGTKKKGEYYFSDESLNALRDNWKS